MSLILEKGKGEQSADHPYLLIGSTKNKIEIFVYICDHPILSLQFFNSLRSFDLSQFDMIRIHPPFLLFPTYFCRFFLSVPTKRSHEKTFASQVGWIAFLGSLMGFALSFLIILLVSRGSEGKRFGRENTTGGKERWGGMKKPGG